MFLIHVICVHRCKPGTMLCNLDYNISLIDIVLKDSFVFKCVAYGGGSPNVP